MPNAITDRINISIASRARLVAAILCYLLLIICSAPNYGIASQQQQERLPLATLSTEARTQIRQAIAAVGVIQVRNHNESGEPRSRGSAVIVRGNGVVVTNFHVINNEKTKTIYDEIWLKLAINEALNKWQRFQLKALIVNQDKDLALLKIIENTATDGTAPPTVFPIVELADTQPLQLLEDLIIIGYPEQGGSTVTINPGVVEGLDLLEDWIKTDARLIHGNSGGAAVNREGKLIGIPTKILLDSQRIDRDGDGFPDVVRDFGAVGFLRPVQLVKALLAQLDTATNNINGEPIKNHAEEVPQIVAPAKMITVRGIILSDQGKPVAGARVGLIPADCEDVTTANLLTWGGTNAEGNFELNRAVPLGRYTLKVKALGYQPYTAQVECVDEKQPIVVKLIANEE